MRRQVAAIICGRLEDDRFPGRNTFPLFGRPLMVYPILAAQHAEYVDKVFVTTDAPSIARVAQHLGVEVIERPVELRGPSVPLEQIVVHGFDQVTKRLGTQPEALVVLLCNAPTVTGGLIDKGVEIVLQRSDCDAVMSVSRHNEYHPRYALHLGADGLLESVAGGDSLLFPSEDAYFPDALLWVLRSACVLTGVQKSLPPNCIVNCSTLRVFPLIHEGYGDVDYVWQIPSVEEWLRRQGFSESQTPYDRCEPKLVSTEMQPAPIRYSKTLATRRVLITTIPFGAVDRRPLELLEAAGADYLVNPIGRRLTEADLTDLIGEFDVLIAGTEPITARVLDRAPRLRLIARVGIGLDNVNLLAARQRGVLVSYTPEAPAPAVAELTMGLILCALRRIPAADRGMRNGVWHRFMGSRLENLTVGVIGVGRVGKRVVQHLAAFGSRILANDLKPDREFGERYSVRWLDKETIYREADILTVHVPLTPLTQNLITREEIALMRPHTILVNTSRGNIIKESDLVEALRGNRLGGAALDVYEKEPYAGSLTTVENCILTCHMGSMSKDCRARMEIEATEEVTRYFNHEPLRLLVPEEEYLV